MNNVSKQGLSNTYFGDLTRMQDMLDAAIKRGIYPIKLTLPEGQLEIFNKRGLDRKGYAAYLKNGESIIPRVGVGPTPEVAFQDIFTDRTQMS